MIASRERNPERSRERLLQAALTEFAENGFAGARVESIARRSGLNKQLISHHFGGKLNLYRAVMNRRRRSNGGEIAADPGSLPGALSTFHELATEDPEWIRVLLWETLERDTFDPDDALEGSASSSASVPGSGDNANNRRAGYEARVAWVAAEQAAGRLPADLDPDLLLMSLLGAALYPLILPEPAALITGEDTTTESFEQRYQQHLRRLAAHLAPEPRAKRPSGVRAKPRP